MFGLYTGMLIAIVVSVCESTCFHEEQSTTPMIALRIVNNIGSWLLCVKECFDNAECVSVAYSDALRVCHLHKTVGLSACNVVPFRRWVKTEVNCQATAAAATGAFYAVDFVRSDPSLEMGIDPCFPDRSLLHPELVVLDGVSPPCPLTKPDGSSGPAYTFRGLDITGAYYTWGVSNLVQAGVYPADNTFALKYGASISLWHRFVSVYCAEIGDTTCSCPSLPLHPNGGTPPLPNIVGACPSQRLYVMREAISPGDIIFDGNTAVFFCSGGRWLAADGAGNSFTLNRASCI